MSKQVRIFLFSDALGYEIVQRYAFMTGKLPFRYRVRTQLGYSSTAVPTILTGTPPTVHRHFSFFYFDRAGSSPFRFFRYWHVLFHPRLVFDHHRVRHKISAFLKKWFRFTGYFNLYRVPYERLARMDYCEKRDLFAKGGLSPVVNLYDMLQAAGAKFHISDWRRGDRANLAEAVELLNTGELEFLFVYTAGLDGMLHFHVSQPEFVKAELAKFQQEVERVMAAAAAHYDDWVLTLFSDHGMTPLTRSVDLRGKFEQGPWKFGRDFAVCYDSTMLRFYVLNEACRAPMMATLDGEPGHWLAESEKRELHIDFDDHQYGDEIFLLDPGVQLAPSDMGAKAIPGMHGYSPDDRDSDACLLSNREPVLIPGEIAEFFALMKLEAQKLKEER